MLDAACVHLVHELIAVAGHRGQHVQVLQRPRMNIKAMSLLPACMLQRHRALAAVCQPAPPRFRQTQPIRSSSAGGNMLSCVPPRRAFSAGTEVSSDRATREGGGGPSMHCILRSKTGCQMLHQE